jgi:pilus assembly protein Flp/PilA
MLASASNVSANRRIIVSMTLASVLVRLHEDERGQGLVEYMLIVLLVAFGATAGMSSLASYMNIAFSNIGLLLNQYIP